MSTNSPSSRPRTPDCSPRVSLTSISVFTTGQPLHRCYFRSAVGVLRPIIVSDYFLATWHICLTPLDPQSPMVFGSPGATWMFYSLFIAGVVRLKLRLYELAGVEADMLMKPAWDVGDAMRLMMHADRTWSGPGHWFMYSNFLRTDTPIDVQQNCCANRIDVETLKSMIPGHADDEWMSTLFTSIAAPSPLYALYTIDLDTIDAGTGHLLQLNYLQTTQL